MGSEITGKSITSKLDWIFVIAGGLSVITGAYWFYRTKIYKPKIQVNNIDYKAGTADISINGKTKQLLFNSTLAAGGEWGVRFNGPDLKTLNRVELVSNDLVYYTWK